MNIEEFEISNKFMVGMQAGKIRMLIPPRGPMTKEEALVLAAWLVCLADFGGDCFEQILEKVQNT